MSTRHMIETHRASSKHDWLRPSTRVPEVRQEDRILPMKREGYRSWRDTAGDAFAVLAFAAFVAVLLFAWSLT